jgi:hypothetical protein
MHRDFVEALEADRFEDLTVDGMILLKWLKELRCVAMDIEFIREHSNGPSGCMKPRYFSTRHEALVSRVRSGKLHNA